MNRYNAVDLTPFSLVVSNCMVHVYLMHWIYTYRTYNDNTSHHNKHKMIVSFLEDEVSFKVRKNRERKYPEGLFILRNHGTALIRKILCVNMSISFQRCIVSNFLEYWANSILRLRLG